MRILINRLRIVVSTAAAALAGAFPAAPTLAANAWGADYFPNVELTTHEGKTVRFYDDLIKGKSVAVNTIFTECHDVCPLETAKMRELQKILGDRVGRDVFFYSISVDPKNDTPAVLKAYAEKFKIGPGWTFLTGKPEDIKLITRKLGLKGTRDTAPREGHSSTLMVGHEPTGQWMKNSSTDNPKFLAATMETFLGWQSTQPTRNYAEARPVLLTNGQSVFQNSCSSCHTVGEGDKIGPDLMDVSARRDRHWLTRYILVPDEVLAAGDPIATSLFKKYRNIPMPNLGLARDEVADVLAYVEARSTLLRAGRAK